MTPSRVHPAVSAAARIPLRNGGNEPAGGPVFGNTNGTNGSNEP